MLPKGGGAIRGGGGGLVMPDTAMPFYPSSAAAYPGGATGDPPAANIYGYGPHNALNNAGFQPEPTPTPGPGPGPQFVPSNPEVVVGPPNLGGYALPTPGVPGLGTFAAPNSGVSVAPPPPPQASVQPSQPQAAPTYEPRDVPPGPLPTSPLINVVGQPPAFFQPGSQPITNSTTSPFSTYSPPSGTGSGIYGVDPSLVGPPPPPPPPQPSGLGFDPGFYTAPNAGVSVAPPPSGGGGSRNL